MYPGTFAKTTPDHPAIIMATSGQTITYAELDRRSMRLAQLLYDRGLRRGDRVAVLAENHPRYFEVFWAAVRSGLYLVAVNRHLALEEANYIVRNSGASAFVSTAALAETASRMLLELDACPTRLMIDGVVAGFEPYEQAIAAYPAQPLIEQWRGDFLLYSSGTTGRPKGVMRALPETRVDTTPGIVSPMEKHVLGMDASTIYLSPAPLYHAAPLGWCSGVHELGGTAIVMEHFDAEQYLATVEKYRVTHSQVVPTMFVRMLKLAESARRRYDLSSLQQVIHAAAPCPPELKRQMIDWLGPIVSEYYSSTEGNGFTFITAQEWLAHPGSVGRPLLGEPHICDDLGVELPPGQLGTLYFNRPDLTFEYFGDVDKTASTRHPVNPEWTTLGDIGYLDEEGYLYLTDRKAFMIISGGVNIYPAEIESCLITHPAVADVAVFGLPNPEMGESVHAAVQLEPGYEPSEDLSTALRAFAHENLAGYKVPRTLDFRDELPRLPTGKLAKGRLRDEYLTANIGAV
ncbi:acyl-CoA synthetase (AMP-forming)/AMP-acid ligase II [Jatrophihabitans sp. GAS493]|uniref:acyl-CoA synthetase n=1 Tax=Jatrophihabitans sp. GAS493 TaxID=1907575 RepID=UPI000BB74824|nr:acyl-CoA synthetase [Jatrophihabitans sp. GAS493]SOD72147.1 acyl-CoA synthetase (AMP-forming)/AMP-acid ligase II [Jatrophihabitans sp. GAS493]